jgi:hypothetical protein
MNAVGAARRPSPVEGLPAAVNHSLQQSLMPRKIDIEELLDATTRALQR